MPCAHDGPVFLRCQPIPAVGKSARRAPRSLNLAGFSVSLGAMKALRSIRFLVGGLLLLTGLVACVQFLSGNGKGLSLSTVLLWIIAGCCVLAPGQRRLRHLIGLGLLIMFYSIATSGVNLGTGLLAMSFLVLAATMFSESLAGVAAKPITGIIDSIYFGNNPYDVPPVTLRLARAYRRDLRFE